MATARSTKTEKLARRARGDPRLGAAVAAWSSLDEAQQRRLTYELAEARADELRRAHPDLVSVGHGYRKAGQARAKSGRLLRRGGLTDEPCVVLTVGRKWPRSRRSRAGELPAYLLAFCDQSAADGRTRRSLCTIPTDVRGADEFRGAMRQGAAEGVRRIVVDRPGGWKGVGTVACAVTVPGRDEFFGLSCYHVLVPRRLYDRRTDDLVRSGETFRESRSSQPIGTLWPGCIGCLTARRGRRSLDAALLRPDTTSALARVCGAVRPARSTWDPSWIPRDCRFEAEAGTLRGRFVAEHIPFSGIDYFGSEPLATQYRILEFEMKGRSTAAGDSGCAVLSEDGTELVGMHLGGINRTSTVFVLPSYELFLGERWAGGIAPVLAPLNW